MPLRSDCRSQDGLGGGCVNFCCCVLLVIVISSNIAAAVFLHNRSQHISPGICQEGRLAVTAPLGNARVLIDMPYSDGPVNIECLLPIAIYEPGGIHGSPRDYLRQHGVQGPQSIPHDHSQSGVQCIPRNASIFADISNVLTGQLIKKCDDEWECGHGKCGAREKALRICLSKVAKEPYDCNYVQGHPEWSVATPAKEASKEISIVITLAVCLCLSVVFILVNEDHDGPEDPIFVIRWNKLRMFWTLAMLGGCLAFSFMLARTYINDLPQPVLSSPADLSEPCTTGDLHMCGPILPEEPPWNHILSPVLYTAAIVIWIVIGPVCFWCCCLGLVLSISPMFSSGPRTTNESPETNERTPLV
eukprot:gnl/TRDRNA2_/TRDRNA2_172508_c0_seq10.p1 gnl/TRDRNA2_/TRDRNA2_172508_c0~~gnl/TRDRNA2_/TRDRNA2_172508_c0_seq10.p1  ORF type:complete len:360 (-),score=6.14 gnl/TRDRNA2_/TRDRNA2_172508_c0_seq10:287-1366(-)